MAYTFTGEFPTDDLGAPVERDTGSALRGRRGTGTPALAGLKFPVKQLGLIKGTQGTLTFGETSVVYDTPRDARTWRYNDIQFISSARPFPTLHHDFGKAVRFSIEASYHRIHLQPALAGHRKKERENPMKKQIAVVFAAAAMAFAAGPQTFTGVITDNMCDNGDHKDMKMGSDPKCVTECVKGHERQVRAVRCQSEEVVRAERSEDAGEIRRQESDRGGDARRCRARI